MVCLLNNSDIWFISPCFVVIIILVCLFEPSCLVGFVLIFLEFNAWILYLHHCPLPLSFQFFPWPPSFSWPPLLYYFTYLIIYVPCIHIHCFYTYMYRHAHPISPFTVVHMYHWGLCNRPGGPSLEMPRFSLSPQPPIACSSSSSGGSLRGVLFLWSTYVLLTEGTFRVFHFESKVEV